MSCKYQFVAKAKENPFNAYCPLLTDWMLPELLLFAPLLVGFLILLWRAARFVNGSNATVRDLDICPMVIGLIVTGTSLPELVISITSSIKGHTDLAIGNIVCSHIFNFVAILSIPCIVSTRNCSKRY